MAAVLSHGKGLLKYLPVEVLPLLIPVTTVAALGIYTGVQKLRKDNDVVANKSKQMPWLDNKEVQVNPLHHLRFFSRTFQTGGGFMSSIPKEFQEQNQGRHDWADPVQH
mmetsp:Transcript_30736/g.49741  ORF Transcript_30736/g.49741 Transcript_30736/m.49741 type:complete len:109 (+) Transcript_30736:151-477(+)|eukprot:CAMPEP_0184648356 /NCGR_PEP_ID=MMETSP0308-20130426/5459_1 /TAXON_ID=38269 /ORGANISM="Gloeochaete witrockiana, Strain SAG 46.84" /LENGTH=108 /DNA_ID=CAMNT_0027080121 /DNA_START=121 /DNA_END=447 /DNA_ORIENTATION=-